MHSLPELKGKLSARDKWAERVSKGSFLLWEMREQ